MVAASEKKVECGGTEQVAVEELRHHQRQPWSPLRAFCCCDDDDGDSGGGGGACGAWTTFRWPHHCQKRLGGACYASLGHR
ncbi:hypothetical protein C1H46_005995 [Malus baccata]|uniref:Uncharacterized protein n=1 Tax=Malus baccata TaxID=106549 RepID=A0A540NBF3_MALBA|nr:hypothetical protein C1H46_005995 [Malus baccata]